MTENKVLVKFEGDNSDLKKKAQEAKESLDDVKKKSEQIDKTPGFGRNIASGLGNIGSRLSQVGKSLSEAGENLSTYGKEVTKTVAPATALLSGGIGLVSKMAWDQVDSVQKATVGLRAYEKDASKVNQVLKDLVGYAQSDRGVLFNRSELFKAASNLRGFGETTENLTGRIEILSKGVALGMTSFDELSQIIGRSAQRGQLTALAYDQLAHRGIILDSSLRGASVSADELYNALDRAIDDSVLDGLADSLAGIRVRVGSALRGIGNSILQVNEAQDGFIKGGAGEQISRFLKELPSLLKDPAVQDGFRRLGMFLAMALEKGIRWATRFIGFIGRNIDTITKIVYGITAFGGALAVAGKTIGVVGLAVKTLGTIFTSLGRTIGFLLSPLGIITAVIAGLVAGLAYLYKTDAGVRRQLQESWQKIRVAIQDAWQKIRPVLELLARRLADIFVKASYHVANFIGWLGRNIDSVLKVAAAIGVAVVAVMALRRAILLVTAAIGVLRTVIAIGSVIQAALSGPFVVVYAVVAAVVAILAALTVGLLLLWRSSSQFRTIVKQVWRDVSSSIVQAWKAAQPAFSQMRQSLSDLMRELGPLIKEISTILLPLFRTQLRGAIIGVAIALSFIADTLRILVATIRSSISGFSILIGWLSKANVATDLVYKAISSVISAQSRLNTSSANLRAALDKEREAHTKVKEAIDAQKEAMDRLNGAQLSAEGAALNVERAQRTYNETVAQYGADSLEAREAAHSLKLAQDSQREASKQLKNATDEVRDSNRNVSVSQYQLRDATKNVEGAQREHEQSLSNYERVVDNVRGAFRRARRQVIDFGVSVFDAAKIKLGLASGGAVVGMAGGGIIQGRGTSTSDSIPAMLSDGEFVLRASAVRRLGVENLMLMNEGREPDTRQPLIGQIIVPEGADPMAFAQQIGARVRFA